MFVLCKRSINRRLAAALNHGTVSRLIRRARLAAKAVQQDAAEAAVKALCFFNLLCVHCSTGSNNLHVTTKKHLSRTSRKKHICKQNAITEIQKNTTDFTGHKGHKNRQVLEFCRSCNYVKLGFFKPNFGEIARKANFAVLNGLSKLFAAH